MFQLFSFRLFGFRNTGDEYVPDIPDIPPCALVTEDGVALITQDGQFLCVG